MLLVNFPGRPQWVASARLREAARWDGTALHIARDPAALLKLRLSAFSWPRIALVLLAAIIAGFVFVSSARARRTRSVAREAKSRAGFTVIELIVVMAVIGILVALIAPAIQNAREASRRAQCQNNLRQIGIGLNAHEAARGQYPSGSSVPRAHPKPPVMNSSVSICYQLLPYMDQRPLFNRVDTDEDGDGSKDEPPTSATNGAVLKISVPAFMCPSDLWFAGSVSYRGCAGTSPGFHMTPSIPVPNSSRAGFATGALLRAQQVRDGLSNTVFFSEKLLGDQNPEKYSPRRDTILNVNGYAHNNFLLPDDAANACRLPYSASADHASFGGGSWLFFGYGHTSYNHILTPNSQTPDCTNSYALDTIAYGAHTARSLHAGGVHVLMGDGATRFINQGIELGVWRALGTIDSGDISRDF